jgi:hypothetical protein
MHELVDPHGQLLAISIAVVDTQVDLAGDATTRTAQPLVGYAPFFSAMGPFLCSESTSMRLDMASSAAPSQSTRPATSAALHHFEQGLPRAIA